MSKSVRIQCCALAYFYVNVHEALNCNTLFVVCLFRVIWVCLSELTGLVNVSQLPSITTTSCNKVLSEDKLVLEGGFTKQDPYRRPWRDVSIRDIVISSTVRSIDHCSASALQEDEDFFFFNRWQNSQRDGFAFHPLLSVSLCPHPLFLSYSLPFLFSLWEKKRNKGEWRKGLGTHVRQALQPLSFHLSGLRALIMEQSLILSRAG